MTATAVVFAYHNVGVRCLSVLLARGVQVALVVTHEDRAHENIWFESVEKLARARALPVSEGVRPRSKTYADCTRCGAFRSVARETHRGRRFAPRSAMARPVHRAARRETHNVVPQRCV